MKHLLSTIALLVFGASACLADMPVAGSTSGTWETVTVPTSPNTWVYAFSQIGANNASYVRFVGLPFDGTTPYNAWLGQISLNNGVLLDGDGIYDNSLNVLVDLTVPGGNLSFVFPFEVQASLRPIITGGRDVLLNLGDVSGRSQSITVAGERYTLTLNGFSDQFGNAVTQIEDSYNPFDWNSPEVVNLHGTFTSTSVSVPDAGSSVMLLGAALLAIDTLRRRFMI